MTTVDVQHSTGSDPHEHPGLSRRRVVVTATGLVAAAAGLAACGGSSSSTTPSAAATSPAGAGGSTPSGSASAEDSGGSGGSGKALAQLSAVAVGSAISVTGPDGKPAIVAQPTAGTVVAFSATCTHKGCPVAPAGGLKLLCPCHGSTYDAATGKNTGGPAPAPLTPIAVKVSGDSIVTS